MPLTDDEAVDAVLSPRAAPKAVPVAPTLNSDDAAVDAVLSTQKTRAQQNNTAATRMSPDQAATVHKLARDAGIAPWAVEGNEAWVLQELTARRNRELIEKNPVMATVIANNPAFADVSFDDMATADKIAKAWAAGGFGAAAPVARRITDRQQQILDQQSGGSITSPARGGLLPELGDAFVRGAARGGIHKTLIATEMGLYDKGSVDLAVQLGNEIRNAARRPMPEDVAAGLEEIKEAGKGTFAETLAAVARNPRAVLEVSAESLSASAPSLVASAAGASLAGPFGTAGGAILGSFAVEYASVLADVVGDANDPEAIRAVLLDDEKMADARKKGVTRGIPIALFDGLTAGLAGRLLAGAKGTVASVGTRAAGELGLQAVGGGAGEAVAGALTNEFNWGDVLLEAFAEIPSAVSEVPSNYATYRQLRANQDAKADAAKLLGTMQQAMESLALKRDPVAFQAFFQEVSKDATVFVDREQLVKVFEEAKLDINEKLPTAAAQLTEASPEGVEIPVAELVANLSGSGIEEQLVQHLRTTPDALTLAEARAEDTTKTTEFFQQEANRILAEQSNSEAFAREAETVKKHVAAQLNFAAAYSPTVNDAMATLAGHAYTVLAERLGMAPREVWNAHRLSIGGVKGQPIPSKGNTLNVGLDVGADERRVQVPTKDVVKAIEDMGVTVVKSSVVEGAEYEHKGKMVKEKTLVIDTDRALTDDEMMRLAEATQQEAIPQRTDGMGKLHGPKAAEWGDFNPEYFYEHNAKRMSETGEMLDQAQSARRPTTKRAPEDHLGEVPLVVDYTAIEPEKHEQNMALVAKYPGMRFKARKAAGRVEEFVQHLTNNLLWLHDQIPAEIRARGKLWYDGARAIVDRWSAKYNLSDAQISAVLAVYSPQKDWFMNVSLAERTLDIVKNKQDFTWSPEMSATLDTIFAADKFALLRDAVHGKKLSELDSKLAQAAWVRVYDESHNNRAHRLVTPEGGFIEYAKTVKDVDKITGWPGLSTIVKALTVIEDGRAETIDKALGAEHKVRSFYNNIFHPNSSYGFTTIDTHAVAAALLRPLSGNSVEVTHNFGSAGSAISAATGMSGTYAYYQEAYRRAAEARGLLPREMQSITWEAVRELYTMPFKHNQEKLNALDAIWTEYEKGQRSIDSVRSEILELAGGVEQPAWIGRDSGLSEKGWASTYTDELLGDQLPRRDTGAVDAGTGERAAALYQGQHDAALVSGPVTGVHFSREKRATLISSAFGTGVNGAERERIARATDPRIKQRIAFYVNTGEGITPEQGVGGVAHTAVLTNLYDGDADALKIFKNNPDDMNAAESAVLDAGYDGYLSRSFGTQGAVVLLGSRAVQVEHVGTKADVNVPVAPAPVIPAMKAAAMALMQNRALPSGQMKAAEWRKLLEKLEPETAAKVSWDKLDAEKLYYRDQIAGELWQGKSSFSLFDTQADLFSGDFVDDKETLRKTVVISSKGAAGEVVLPNVDSTGRQIARTKQGLERFWSWYGDGPVDDKHRPITMYHSTNVDVSSLQPGLPTKNNLGFLGDVDTTRAAIFVTPDREFSQEYLRTGAGQNVMPVFAAVQNPFDSRDGISIDQTKQLVAEGISERWLYTFVGPDWEMYDNDDAGKNAFVDALKRLGYDGAVFNEEGRDGKRHTTYAAFSPTQIKSAIGNTGEFNPNDPNILHQGKPSFYSQLAVALQNAPAKAVATGATASAWLKSNAGKLGVKADEIKWSGILDWLETKDKVSKEEITAYLDQGGVRITEKILDDNDVLTDVDIHDGLEHKGFSVFSTDDGRWEIFDTETKEKLASKITKWDVADWITEHTEDAPVTKYGQYVLPGGENYKELLLTLPAAEKPPITASDEEKTAWADRAEREFRSSHFGQPNIVAHIRINERTDADGNRVLFVEEIQSDWAQKGRKEGFVRPDTGEAEVRKLLGDAGYDVEYNGVNWVVTARDGGAVPNKLVGGEGRNQFAGNLAQVAQLVLGREDLRAKRSAVPSAPFVTDTKAWTSLAIKRVMMYAVENGFDKIAWTTGEQQAARYDLSKQVSSIAYLKNKDGTFHVTAVPITSDANVELGTHNTVADLEEKVGKDIAQKIANGEGEFTGGDLTVLRGLDLKVGGEGMKAYYDEIVPQVVKKLGGKLETVAIDDTPKGGVLEFRPASEGGTRRNADERALIEQPGFTIPQSLRDQIAERGMPLFATQEGGPKLGSFNPSTLELNLLADANLTTFLHELGHFFLTVYADVATQENAPQNIKDDVNTLLKWFGVQDLATWNAMPLDQQRPYHEQFAESFEQYLFSGKSPSLEMQSLFTRFAAFMKRVYGTLKQFLATHTGAKLNPEVEAVMERMLATEREIAAANDHRNFVALFKSAAEGQMTDKQFADYMALTAEQQEDAEALLRSRSLRDMKWLQARRNKVIAEMQKATRDKRAAMLAKVKEELAATPLRQAMRWLKRGEMTTDEGTEFKAEAGHRLQISEVEALFPEGAIEGRPDIAKLGYGQYGMLAETGLHPDTVADMFGFSSGEALVRELIAAPKFADEAEAITDQRMLEEYGDLTSEEAIARAADEAIHNEARLRAVATELAALAENVGSPAALNRAAKTYAKQLVDGKTSKTLKPWAFAAAATRAGKEAMKHLRKGDRAAAAKAVRTELANLAAAKEAYAAEAEIKDIVAKLKKIAAYSDKHSSVTSRDMATVQAVRSLLGQVGIGSKGETAAEYLELVNQYDPVTGQNLKAIIDDIGTAQDWRTLKVTELRTFAEDVTNLWARAKSLREFVVGEKRMSLEAAADEILEVLKPHLPTEKLGTKNAVTEKEQRWLSYSGLKSVFARIELWANRIDNTQTIGPIARYMVNTIKTAEAAYLVQRDGEMKQLEARIKAIAPLLKPRLIEAPELDYTFGKGSSRSGLAELVGAILHTGNASNKQKLLLGRGWATVRQDGTLDTTRWDAFVKRMQTEGVLTKDVYDFAQGTWDMFERIKPDMQQAHKAVFGRFFGEITAESFETPYGTYAGGYVPAMTDRDIVHDMDVKELDLETLGGISHSLPAPANGMTKERSNSYNKPLALDLTLLPMQTNKALLFAHMAAPVQQVQRLVNHTVVKDALDQAFPGARKHMIMPWLARAATHRTSLLATEFGDTGNWWKRLRSNTGAARMMANLVNTLQQYTGVLTAAGVLEKPRYLMYATPALLGIGDLRAQVREMSPYMATRMDNELSAISANIHEIMVNPSVYEKVDNWTRRNAYFMQQWADVHLSPVVWIAAYNSIKDAHPETTEQDARDYADSVIRRTQGATGATDISTFESGTPFAQMFTQFFSWSLMQGQTIMGELRKNANSERSPLAKVGRASGIVVSMILAQSIIAEAIALAFRGGPDDDDGDGQLIDDWLHQVLLMGPVKFMVGTVPVLGKGIVVVINKTNDKPYDDRLSAAPAFSAIENAAGAPASVYHAIMGDGKPSKAIRDVSELATLFGIPAAPLARPVGYLSDVATGHVEPTSAWDFARGTITGTASPGSKQ